MGLTARTGQQAVPWTHLPRGCPPLAAGPPPRRVCFLGCSQTALEKGIRSCYLPNCHSPFKVLSGSEVGVALCRARGSSPQEQTCHLRLSGSLWAQAGPSGLLPLCSRAINSRPVALSLENLSLTPEGCACPSAQGHSPVRGHPDPAHLCPHCPRPPAPGIILLWGGRAGLQPLSTPPAPHAASLVQKNVLLDARGQRSSPSSRQ